MRYWAGGAWAAFIIAGALIGAGLAVYSERDALAAVVSAGTTAALWAAPAAAILIAVMGRLAWNASSEATRDDHDHSGTRPREPWVTAGAIALAGAVTLEMLAFSGGSLVSALQSGLLGAVIKGLIAGAVLGMFVPVTLAVLAIGLIKNAQ